MEVLGARRRSFQWNMGPDQHAQLDGFSLFLPFPSRVAVLLLAGEYFL